MKNTIMLKMYKIYGSCFFVVSSKSKSICPLILNLIKTQVREFTIKYLIFCFIYVLVN